MQAAGVWIRRLQKLFSIKTSYYKVIIKLVRYIQFFLLLIYATLYKVITKDWDSFDPCLHCSMLWTVPDVAALLRGATTRAQIKVQLQTEAAGSAALIHYRVRCNWLDWWIDNCNQHGNDKHMKKSDSKEQVQITPGMIRGNHWTVNQIHQMSARVSETRLLKFAFRLGDSSYEHRQWTWRCTSRRLKNKIQYLHVVRWIRTTVHSEQDWVA